MNYTTSDLITLVKERETIPHSGAAYSDATLVRYLDQALKAYIVPAMEAVCEEYFVVTQDFTDVDGNVLPIPTEATGYRLRDVYVVSSSGQLFNLPRLTPTQAAQHALSWASTSQSAQFAGFFLQGNTVQLWPYDIAAGARFRLTFQRSPADLVLTTSAGQVITVNSDTLTLDKVLTGWNSPNDPPRVGVLTNEEPHDFVLDSTAATPVYASPAVLNDVQSVSCAANVMVLPAGKGANIQVGDWVCGYREAVFAQNIPRELMPCLIQKAAEMCIHAAGDEKGSAMANREFTMLLQNALKIIAPRVVGKPPTIITQNTSFNAVLRTNLGRW